MAHRYQRRTRKAKSEQLKFFVLLLILFLVIGLGRIAASATEGTKLAQVDAIPPPYQLGHQIYLENCGTCHIALPPQTMPTQTWQQLLQDSEHYGVQIPLLKDPNRLILWNYLQIFSRPGYEEEPIPYRLAQSRYFKALHPLVKLPRPLNPQTCTTCHPQADKFNFRTLVPNWESDRRD